MRKIVLLLTALLLAASASTDLCAQTAKIKIKKQYLNFPLGKGEKGALIMEVDGNLLNVTTTMTSGTPKSWAFRNVSAYIGKTMTLTYKGDPKALDKIVQSDKPLVDENNYGEKNRPQYHFSTKNGFINDPNGMVYHDGEYHLFYQHNPYGTNSDNKHWGHTVSRDLLHWEELAPALEPDDMGQMWSGSAVVDHNNSAGFNVNGKRAIVAFYTARAKGSQVQCLAYSLDNGRTFTKYEGNPIIDSCEKWNSSMTRDPRVFWYAPGNHWVMVLYEVDGFSIYNSTNLKDWTYESHITGFFECPDLVELAIDGNPENKKWVMIGASGVYLIGSFDGKTFVPENRKQRYVYGCAYAAQTFTNIPQEDGRVIQIAWGRKIDNQKSPFCGIMQLPTELSLKTTDDGLRVVSKPVKEVSNLLKFSAECKNASVKTAHTLLANYDNEDCLYLRLTFRPEHTGITGLQLDGQNIVEYDVNSAAVNGFFYCPQGDPTSLEITCEVYIDKTSVEVFVEDGLLSYSLARVPVVDKKTKEIPDGLRFTGGNRTKIQELKIYTVESIWK